MKKLIVLALVLSILMSFAGCGGAPAAPQDGGSSAAPAAPAAPASKGNALPLGSTIDTGFATFSFDSALVHHKVGGNKSYRPATDGMMFFCMQGTIRNTSGSELKLYQLAGEMTFGGTYTYTVKGAVSYADGIDSVLAPLMEGRFLIYAEVPDALIDQLTDCTVVFSFNEGFESTPEKPTAGKYCYEVYLDEAVCATAKEGPVREMVYFEECPILPSPESYADVRQSSRSSSSINGKASKISYTFMADMGSRDSVDVSYEKYVEGLRGAGFTVQAGAEGDEIFSGSTKLAVVQHDSNSIKFSIMPGNEGLTAPAAGEAPAEGASTDTEVALGSPIENDYVYLKLDKTGSTNELRSSYTSSSYFYYTSKSGNSFFYLQGAFKNLGGAPVDIANTYITFTFDGKYTYAGKMVGFSDGYSGFIYDVSPLSNVGCYVYADIPQELLNTYSTCVVRIGFTKDFSYVVNSNNLPIFEHCDDIYAITLTR